MDLDPQAILTRLLAAGPVFLFSLVFHEYCHALAAYRLGDRTAAWSGRLTLDPRVHIDLMGSIVMPILGLFTGFIFGWAKPVPFNPANLRNPARDTMLIALAGPVSNLLLLGLSAGVVRGALSLQGVLPPVILEAVLEMGYWSLMINALLAVFNMIPLPPLDGSKVLAFFLPPEAAFRLLSFSPTYSFAIILVLVWNGLLNAPMSALLRVASAIVGA